MLHVLSIELPTMKAVRAAALHIPRSGLRVHQNSESMGKAWASFARALTVGPVRAVAKGAERIAALAATGLTAQDAHFEMRAVSYANFRDGPFAFRIGQHKPKRRKAKPTLF